MSTHKHTILPVEKPDLPFLGEFLHIQKLALSINRLLFKDWPNDAAQKPLYMNAIEGGFADPTCEGFKVVDYVTGDIVGYVGISRKLAGKVEVEKKEEEAKDDGEGEVNEEKGIPDFFEPEVLKTVMSAVREINKETKKIDHFELTYIAVKIGYRRQGIGSELVKIAFDRAKDAGLPLVVSAEPMAYEFFKSLGFKDVKHVDMDLSTFAPKYSGFGMFRLAGMIWNP